MKVTQSRLIVYLHWPASKRRPRRHNLAMPTLSTRQRRLRRVSNLKVEGKENVSLRIVQYKSRYVRVNKVPDRRERRRCSSLGRRRSPVAAASQLPCSSPQPNATTLALFSRTRLPFL